MKFYQYLEQESNETANEFIGIVTRAISQIKALDDAIHYTTGVPAKLKLTDSDKDKVIDRFKKQWPESRFYTTMTGQEYFILKK